MLQVKNLKKSFSGALLHTKRCILDGLTFSIQSNTITGLIGINGVGKTTLIKLIMGFIFPDEGEIIFSPEIGKNPLKILSSIGFLPERPYYYSHLTGEEFLLYMGRLSKIPEIYLKERISSLAKRLNMVSALKLQIKSYSKGMLQRIGVISAILHDPQFIIMDEPFSGLDPVGRRELKDFLVELNREGKTIFFSAHNLIDIEEIAEDVVVIENKKIIYSGPVANLLFQQEKRFSLKVDIAEENNLNLNIIKKGKVVSGQLIISNLTENEKNKLVLDLNAQGINIAEIEKDKKNLEEVLYNINKTSYIERTL